MADDRVAAAAALFAQAWLDGTTIDTLPDELAPRDEAEATAMQDAMAARIGEDIVGWKIAGRPGAPFGRIFVSTSFESGATLPAPRYAGNIMECEVGFKLNRDLPPREQPYEREEVGPPPPTSPSTSSSSAFAVPTLSSRWRRRSPPASPIRTTRPIGWSTSPTTEGTSASSSAPWSRTGNTVPCPTLPSISASTAGRPGPLLPKQARGEPFDVLLWVANNLSRRGIGLKAGHIITPGSVNVPVPLPAGSTAVAVFEDLGQITVSLAAA